jgi:hypothetical protein
MIRPAPRSPAPWRRVLGAEWRAAGVALRPLFAVVGVLGAALLLLSGLAALRDGKGVHLVPTYALLSALVGGLVPIAVWRGEYRVRRSYLASLPVDRAGHVLLKVAAGWGWLLLLTAAFLLGLCALALATGGTVGVDELRVMRRDLPGGVLPVGVLPADVGRLARRWSTPGWHWASFFTGATAAYLLGSAVVLAGSRARRWLGGLAVLAAFGVVLAGQGAGVGGVGDWMMRGVEVLVEGRYGAKTLFLLGDEDLLRTAAGQEYWVWGDLPTPGAWALTALLWIGAPLIGVVAAARREGEG